VPRTPWPLSLASHSSQVAVKAQATAAAKSGKQLAAGQRKTEGAALKAQRRTHAQQLAALREDTGAAKRETVAWVRVESAKAAKVAKGRLRRGECVCVLCVSKMYRAAGVA